MRPVRLYESSIPSGNAYKVSLMLAHLGIDIPVPELDDGSYLPESNAILYFLASGTPYLPDDALGRARALQWMFFEQYSHEPYVAVLKFWTIWGGLHRKRPDEIALLRERGQAALVVMETHLAAHDWFTGRGYGVADIALYAYSHSAGAVGFDLEPLPAV